MKFSRSLVAADLNIFLLFPLRAATKSRKRLLLATILSKAVSILHQGGILVDDPGFCTYGPCINVLAASTSKNIAILFILMIHYSSGIRFLFFPILSASP
ncbi:hypothetical protein BLNAU_8292 [Blattamonas nauphoetae]|uniref:Uncharacterized protein n=1 Tax=Blattamonas nauphoetae TaxID=2049346 RepID=A0ABQ9XYT9_9EUKA|nr:hypothetical protein BLNAU_8292 [Blattamonas nauphoetae]